MHKVTTVVFGLFGSLKAQDYVSDCPEKFGFFADALQCDRYYQCEDGEVSEHFCPDGLVFDEASESFAKCSFPFSIDCTGREERQPANPTPGCPRQHGYFPHPNPEVCDKFNFCVDGHPNTITCPGGLIFDPAKGQCAYSDQTDRPGCTSGDLFKFECPGLDVVSAHEHSRHPDPNDCQFFYLCIEGRARRNGCSVGMVFNPVSLSCERQDKVEGSCGNWYNQTFLESLNPKQNPDFEAAIQTRKRPKRPLAQTPRRQLQHQLRPEPPLPQQLADLNSFGQAPSAPRRQPLAPERDLPDALAALESFGQETTGSFGSSGSRGSSSVRGSVALRGGAAGDASASGTRGRVRQRNRGSLPRRQQVQSIQSNDEPREPFRRPPLRRPETRPEIPDQESFRPGSFVQLESVQAVPRREDVAEPQRDAQSFGRRRVTGRRRVPNRAQATDDDLLSQVEEELARREAFGAEDIQRVAQRAPARGSSFSEEDDFTATGPRTRGRGAPGGRGRLEVVNRPRPALQNFDEEESDFASFEQSRQRFRG